MKFKKFLVFILCLFINISFVSASVKTYERVESKNWGVNKHWNLTSKNLDNVKKTPLVDSSLKIYDFADIISSEDEADMKKLIDEFVAKTKIDMVFVTIDMPYTVDSKNEDYAADFYDYNDFGLDFSHYSGIVLLRNNYSKDRYYDMYTFGDAQLYFDQTRYDDILDSIYDDFHSDKYMSGFELFVKKCTNYYDRGYAVKYQNSYVDDDGFIHNTYHVPVFICLGGASLITIIVMAIMIGKNKMVRKATLAGAYLDKGSINYTVKTDQFLHSHTTHYTVSSSSGGGGGHVGSSGGGHSSGGGRHG
jgi:uncharacterized membrane protein YgcG